MSLELNDAEQVVEMLINSLDLPQDPDPIVAEIDGCVAALMGLIRSEDVGENPADRPVLYLSVGSISWYVWWLNDGKAVLRLHQYTCNRPFFRSEIEGAVGIPEYLIKQVREHLYYLLYKMARKTPQLSGRIRGLVSQAQVTA